MINVYDTILSDPAYFKQLSVKNTLWVNYQCPQVVDWAELYSPLNFVIYTISGRKALHSPGQSLELTEGSLVFLKKGAIRHKKFFDEVWNVVVFCIPDSYLQQSLKEYRSQMLINPLSEPLQEAFMPVATNNATNAFFYSLLPYFTQVPPAPENLLELKFRELIFNILSHPANTALIGYIDKICNSKKAGLIETMESNYLYNLSLEEFAKINQRSLTAFKRDFMEAFHTSPGRWLIQRRLQYAETLLTGSEKNVNEISYESGFETAAHFSRLFKQKFNIPPLKYRKQVMAGRLQH